MSGPQIAIYPTDDESFYPDLGSAISAIGEEFEYQMCEQRPLSVPDVREVHEFVGDHVACNSSLFDNEMAYDLAHRVAPEVEALVAALEERNGFAWYPVGEVLKWAPEPEDGS